MHAEADRVAAEGGRRPGPQPARRGRAALRQQAAASLSPRGLIAMDRLGQRLAAIRGRWRRATHNARTIAALTTNPGCARRAVLDCAGVDKQRAGRLHRLPGPVRPVAVRHHPGQRLRGPGQGRTAAPSCCGCCASGSTWRSPRSPTTTWRRSPATRARTCGTPARAPCSPGPPPRPEAGTLFDHPLLRLEVAGQPAYLEPDLIAFQHDGRFHVVEIKSFAVIDGQADSRQGRGRRHPGGRLRAGHARAARRGRPRPGVVSHDVVLVCPRDFSNQPMACWSTSASSCRCCAASCPG